MRPGIAEERRRRQIPKVTALGGSAMGRVIEDEIDQAMEYSFPASDPPFYMGSAAIAGAHRTPNEKRAVEHIGMALAENNHARAGIGHA
jgi:hypothetical protein